MKKNLQRIMAAMVVLGIVLTCFTACGGNNYDDYTDSYDDYSYEDEWTEESFGQFENPPEQEDGSDSADNNELEVMAELNDDGVYDIGAFGSWEYIDGIFYGEDYDESSSWFYKKDRSKIFVYSALPGRIASDSYNSLSRKIGVYDKNSEIGLYEDYDQLSLMRIDSNIAYTYDINFAGLQSHISVDMFEASTAPRNFGYPAYGAIFNSKDSDTVELNGNDYYDYVNENALRFVDYRAVSCYDDYMIMPAEKDEEIEIGMYSGTEWVTLSFKPALQYFIFNMSVTDSAPVEKTRDGYFKVDLSSLEDGYYFVKELRTVIKVV